ncbi:flagellar protein FliT [Brevibacillus sp. NPDC003359]|uniref:flagellar protein FliT n=1 Tax=unclassified Brevibacillus TaxID=2684853 RepID=UPI00367A5780
MMEKTIEELLERLLRETLRLEEIVMQDDSEPEEWLTILDEREKLIELLQEKGLEDRLTDSNRQLLSQVFAINQRLFPLIEGHKQEIQQKLNNVQRSRMVTNSYQDAGPNGYGAFFDRKK